MSAQREVAPAAPAFPADAEQSPLRAFAWVALAVLATIAAALLLWQFRTVLLLLVAAIALAATIRPIAAWPSARGLRRSFVTTLLVLLVIAGLLVVVGFSAYVLAEDLPRAAAELQLKYAQMRSTMAGQTGWQGIFGQQLPAPEGLGDWVARTQLGPIVIATNTGTSALPATADSAGSTGSTASPPPAEELNAGAERASGMLRLFAGTTSSVLGLFMQFIVLVFLSLYWSLDRDWFERLWFSLLPAGKRNATRITWHALENAVGAHVRSEFAQALLAFLSLYAGFKLMGAEYPLLMAWAAALAWMIPLVGWLAALAPVLIFGLLSGPLIAIGAALYLTLILIVLEFGVEPRLDKRRRAGSIAGLIVALIMLQAFGIVGLVVASPLAVAVDILLDSLSAPIIATMPPVHEGPIEHLEARVIALRAAMGEADEEIPLSTRNLYERLQRLLIDAEKAL